MLVELIYTSAAETLDGPGYGVVSKTEGLPRDLEKFLRQLNRYDYELSAGGDQGHEGPVVFSHTTSQDTSEVWHVLSRVGFGGFDYTQRAVFLAHHVAIRSRDLGSVRVADLLRSPSLFLSRWDGPIGHRPARNIPGAARPDRGRDLWKSVAGHPDWAKNWVELWSQQNGQPCFLVTPPGTDVVGLFAGASSLLDADQANRIDLVSHLDTDRAGVRFDWIGLSAGGPFARSIQNRFAERTMDLARPLGGSPPPIAPKPPKATAKSPAPRTPERARPVANAQSADEYWLEPPVMTRGSKRSQPRLPAEPAPPPPPPPDQMPSTWTRPLMVAGGLVLGLTLIGSGWWFGKNSRVERTTVASNKSDVDPGRDPGPDPGPTVPTKDNPPAFTPVGPRIPPAVLSPTPPAVLPKPEPVGGTPPDGVKPMSPAKPVEIKPLLKLRPVGKWPLRELVTSDQPTLAELPGDGYSGLELLVPEGAGIKVQKTAEQAGRIILEVVSDQGPDQGEKIELILVPGATANRPESQSSPNGSTAPAPEKTSASIKGHYSHPNDAKSLLRRLNFCVLRVKQTTSPHGEPIQPIDVYFTPELPGIPIGKTWDDVESPLKEDALIFFATVQEALQSQNPLKPDFRLGPVSLSVLPIEVRGWESTQTKGPEPWSPGKELNAEFVMTQRDQVGSSPWTFVLTLKTNFDLLGEGGGNARSKPFTDSAVTRKANSATSPEAKRKGDSLLDMLKQFGRVSGSIFVAAKAKALGQPDGPTEEIEILRFDKGSSAPTK